MIRNLIIILSTWIWSFVCLATNPLEFESSDLFYKNISKKFDVHISVKLSKSREVHLDNFWHYWYALPISRGLQKLISPISFSIQPTSITEDVHGNKIAYWTFEKEQQLNLDMSFKIEVKNFILNFDLESVPNDYDIKSPVYHLYTTSDRLININSDIKDIAKRIFNNCNEGKNPYFLARCTFQWVLNHMVYTEVSGRRDRGTDAILADNFDYNGTTYYRGDCGSYSIMYIALTRALGIPSRMIAGAMAFDSNVYHMWAETLVPGIGWIPVDPTVADGKYDEGEAINKLGEGKKLNAYPSLKNYLYYFGNIDSFRYISSVGNEIKLSPRVSWDFSDFNFSFLYHDGFASIMQIGVANIFLDGAIDTIFNE